MSLAKNLAKALGRKPVFKSQGKIIAEADDDGYLILFPDGVVEGASSKAKAKAKISKWLKANMPEGADAGVSEIEWR